MSGYVNEAVPFVLIDNRQVLTDQQIAKQPWLRDFVGRFPHCFERDELRMCYFFYPEGDIPGDRKVAD